MTAETTETGPEDLLSTVARLRIAGYVIVDDPERDDLQAPFLVCGNCEFMCTYTVPARTLPPVAPGAAPREVPAQVMAECRWGPPTAITQTALSAPGLMAVLMPEASKRGPAILGAGPNQVQQRVNVPSAISIGVVGLVASYPPVATEFPACGRFQLAGMSQNETTEAEKGEVNRKNPAQPA